MSEPRVVTQPLGGSALSDAVATASLGPGMVDALPMSVDAWRQRARDVASRAAPGWLDRLADAFGGDITRLGRVQRAAATGGVVVTTGQQAGLFGGPMYTWSKAIGALALADELERTTGIATAPVFWAATDDADFVEASHTHIVLDGVVQDLTLPPAESEGAPMAVVPLVGTEPLRERLRAACRSMAFRDAWEAIEAAYVDGHTVGDAYVQLLRALLEPLGIAVLDSSHPQVRVAGTPVTRLALERAAEVEVALRERSDWLVAHGHRPQVADVPALSTVFELDGGRKRRVPVARAAHVAGTSAEGALSPNVLLRPVMERAILPTVCYVAGPGELAYFAQVPAVADALGVARPMAVPRWSCTIVEPAVDRALARLGVELDEMSDAVALERRLAHSEIPQKVQRALADLRGAMTAGVQNLGNADAGVLLPPKVLEGAGHQLAFRLDRLERRLAAAAKRRGSDALRDLALARASLWPDGHRQERTLNFIPFIARFGPALWEQMRTRAAEHAERLVGGSRTRG